MFEEVIRDEDVNLLSNLPEEITKYYYLAGGTALALHLGHRYSNDFDFFSNKAFNNEQLKQSLRNLGTFKLFQDAKGTLECVIQNTRFTFLFYSFPLLDECISFQNIQLTTIRDLAVMKLSALSSRGSRKDFVDLYFIHHTIAWENIVEDFMLKYKGSGYNLYHIIKSLTYFSDALTEPMPKMIQNCDWGELESEFKKVQKELAERYL